MTNKSLRRFYNMNNPVENGYNCRKVRPVCANIVGNNPTCGVKLSLNLSYCIEASRVNNDSGRAQLATEPLSLVSATLRPTLSDKHLTEYFLFVVVV